MTWECLFFRLGGMVASTLYRPMMSTARMAGEERLKIMWIGRLWQDFAKVGAKLVEKLVGHVCDWVMGTSPWRPTALSLSEYQ